MTSQDQSGRTRVLVRAPSPEFANGLLTHIQRLPVDFSLAERQWDSYVDALQSFGWVVIRVPSLPAAPDSAFVEDTVVMLGQVALITRSGAEDRRCESSSVRDVLSELGYQTVFMGEPGCLDGGDVLKVGGHIYVGLSTRTDIAGIDQFRVIADRQGFEVSAVPTHKALHLKSSVTALPDGTIIGHPDTIDSEVTFPRFLTVPEVTGTQVLVLDQETVLMSASAPESARLFRQRGLRVIRVDISEFEKLEGSVTCLSVRLRA